MLVECEKCGAPLDVKESARLVKCSYCGTSTQVQSTRTLAVQTPTNWKPPPVWTPPSTAQIAQTQLQYQRRIGGRSAGCASLFGVLFIGGLVVVPMLIPLLATNAISIPFINKVARWDKASTLTCDLNEELVLEDVTASVPSGPVINANTNCHLTLRRCHLEGTTIVQGGINTTITVEDSQLIATDAAITGDANLEVHVRGQSTIEAGSSAIRGTSGTKVDVEGPSTISGRNVAIENDVNLAVQVSGARVVSPGTAVRGRVNAQLRVTNGTIEGGDNAWDFSLNARITLISSNVIGARSTGSNATIEER